MEGDIINFFFKKRLLKLSILKVPKKKSVTNFFPVTLHIFNLEFTGILGSHPGGERIME